jgi:hypothetical protein
MSQEIEAIRMKLLEKEVELNRVTTQLQSIQTSYAQREVLAFSNSLLSV